MVEAVNKGITGEGDGSDGDAEEGVDTAPPEGLKFII